MRIVSGNYVLFLSIGVLLGLIPSSEQTVYTCNPSASCGCSTNSTTVNRIVGGENASPATWSWAVSISIGGTYLCGGSIISSSWVITAAHCVYGFRASQITIFAGSNIRFTGTQTSVGVQLFIHPSYNPRTYVFDIALLQLATPLSLSDPYVSQICLPTVSALVLATTEWPPVNTSVVAVGWGTLSEGGILPTSLQQVTVQVVSDQAWTCSPSITDWTVQFCAGVVGGGKDTCQGDSGGPLMTFDSTNRWVLAGVTSNGIGCARANSSGVYTRVATFQGWISSTMNSTAYAPQRPIYRLSFFAMASLVLTTYF